MRLLSEALENAEKFGVDTSKFNLIFFRFLDINHVARYEDLQGNIKSVKLITLFRTDFDNKVILFPEPLKVSDIEIEGVERTLYDYSMIEARNHFMHIFGLSDRVKNLATDFADKLEGGKETEAKDVLEGNFSNILDIVSRTAHRVIGAVYYEEELYALSMVVIDQKLLQDKVVTLSPECSLLPIQDLAKYPDKSGLLSLVLDSQFAKYCVEETPTKVDPNIPDNVLPFVKGVKKNV